MTSSTPTLAGLSAAALLALSGCDKPPETPTDPLEPAAAADGAADTGALPADTVGDVATLDALVDESEIPYPVYPNGAKYRVGGENGLKIVLFETTDSFEEVDAYYGDRAEQAGMPRLAAMDDYVRYSRENGDDDPWATHRPGIVIHRFGDDEARDAVGADPDARTNIIMSF